MGPAYAPLMHARCSQLRCTHTQALRDNEELRLTVGEGPSAAFLEAKGDALKPVSGRGTVRSSWRGQGTVRSSWPAGCMALAVGAGVTEYTACVMAAGGASQNVLAKNCGLHVKFAP